MSLATILGLVVSLLAVIATVAIGALRFRHERKLADIGDARSILAEGALELGRMKSVMKDALTKFAKPLTGKGEWPPDSLGDVVTQLEGAYDAARSVITVYGLANGTEADDDHSDYAEALMLSTNLDSRKNTY